MQLIDLTQRCRQIYDAAVRDLGPDLGGFSPLDLLADNITDQPIRALQDAAVVAGIPGIPSERRYS